MKSMYVSIKYRFTDILLKKKHKLHYSDILLKKKQNINFTHNHLVCCNHTCYSADMVSVTSASRYVTSASGYQSRS